ncbi:MAG TPA: glutamate--tRNA ligase family protein, partial [Mycobacteriales bacterium]|nr:glutamate--tRNA ligase family protein [Mycobacteriales bacterium]
DAAQKLVADGRAYVPEGEESVIRFRVPKEGVTTFTDVIRGEVSVKNDTLEDFVIVRSTGHPTFYLANAVDDVDMGITHVIRGDITVDNSTLEEFVIVRSTGHPTFYLANAVDDVDMGITHVIRGEDLLPSTARVLLLREALGTAAQPVFAHLPLLVGQDRQKLSKRHGDVALEDYRDKGYLAEALRNYLALLGWAPRDGREILPIEDAVAEFRLEDVTKAAAFFDHQKLDHINSEYIRSLPVPTFVRESLPWLETDPPWPPENFDLAAFERVAPFVQERVRVLSEVRAIVDFLFLDAPAVDADSWEKGVVRQPAAAALLDDAVAAYEACGWDPAALRDATAAIAEAHGLKLAKAQAPIRVAVTGRTVGIPLFESLHVLGRERT